MLNEVEGLFGKGILILICIAEIEGENVCYI